MPCGLRGVQIPSECVISFDTWLRVTAAAGQLTYDLLLQQLAAIEFCAVQSLERESRGGGLSASGCNSRSQKPAVAWAAGNSSGEGRFLPHEPQTGLAVPRPSTEAASAVQSSPVLQRRCERLWALLSLDW